MKSRIVRGNPYAGKNITSITLAPTKRVASLTEPSDTFMKKVLGLAPGDYLITDESRLSDFTAFGSGDISRLLDKIKRIYKIDVSDVDKGKTYTYEQKHWNR
jgi:hypothetical protein